MQIQVARIQDLVKRFFGIKSEFSGSRLASEVSPVFVVAQAIHENALTAGIKLFSGHGIQAGVAGQVSAVALTNPTDSGIVATVKRIMPAASGAGSWSLRGRAGGPLTTIVSQGFNRDRRLIIGSSALRISRQTVVDITTISTGVAERINLPTDSYGELIREPYILGPGDGLIVDMNVVNSSINVSWEWDERVLESGEED